MRIEKAVIENINSLAGRFEIDLCDPAYAGGLFAIVGPSGAGKTTVLDALCLALYGKTPRVSSISDMQDELMNKNAQYCLAETVFTARGKRYKAVFVHERSKGSKPYRAAKRELYEQKADGWHVLAARIREMDEMIVEITGLDFSRFTRSIMLAQFRFAEFLQADSTARAEILEKITEMDIYRRISAAVYRKTKLFEQELKILGTRMGEVKLISSEQENLLEDEQRQLVLQAENHTALGASLRSCESKAAALAALKEKHLQYSQAQRVLDEAVKNAQEKQKEAAQLFEKQQEVQDATATLLKQVRALDLKIQAQDREIARIDLECDEEKKQIRENKSRILDIFKKHFPQAPADEYKMLYESAGLGEKLKQNAKIELEQAKAQAQAIRLETDSTLMQKEQAYWQRRTAALRVAVPMYEATQALENMHSEIGKLKELHNQLMAQSAAADKEAGMAKQSYEHAMLDSRLAEERKDLKDGQPCPLCGAQHHPYAGKTQSDSTFIEAKNTYDAACGRQQHLRSCIIEAQTRIDDLQKRIDEKTQAIKIQNAALEKLGGTGQTQAGSFDKALEEAENILSKYSALQARLRKAAEKEAAALARFSSVDKDAEVIEMHRKMADNIAVRLQSREQERLAAAKSCEALREERHTLFENKDADAEEEAVFARLKQAQANMEAGREAAEQARREADKNLASMARTKSDADEQQAQLEKAYAAVCSETAAVRFDSDDEDISSKLASFMDTAQRLGTQPQPTALNAAAKALAQLVLAEEARRAVIGQILKTNAQSRQALKAMKKEEAEQKRSLKKWEKLNALIGSADGAKFSRMAQSITFDALLAQANMVLRRLSDRYILVRDKTNPQKPLELAVADTYQAGEIRPVVNLSGGESFIVSLALALGLSEMSAGAARIDSLFIDEGFASLDEAYMEAALQTLCALGAREGKLIGVISHVEALKERIDVQIELRRLSGGRATLHGPGVTAKPG